MASSPVEDLTAAAKDVAFVSIGLGLLAFQRLQVRRTELARSLGGPAEEAKGTLEVIGGLVGERVKLVEERIGAVLQR
jgi:hypothetical protein